MEVATKHLRGTVALVTGGAGFIGSHVVDALLAAGAKVRVLDDLSSGRRENLANCLDRIDFMEADIRAAAACREACQGIHVVFHEAALGSVPRSMKAPATTININVGGTANVFEAARDAGVRRVVYASSSSVYGDSEGLPKREGEEGNPLSPYALSKVVDEQMARVFANCYRMELVGLRYFNVFGPRQDPEGPYAAVIPLFFKACLSRMAPGIYGDGEQSRDFTYIDDVVAANLLSAVAPPEACGRAYNMAGGVRVTVNDLAAAVRNLVGGDCPPPSYLAPRPGDIPHSLADLTQARNMLGYRPAVTVPEGLERARGYYVGLYKAGDGC